MTTDVITVSEDASVAPIVTLLKDHRISAVPITDRFDVVLGIVSWTDLHEKIELGGEGVARTGWWHWWSIPLLQWPHGSAAEVMSAPPLTIAADASLAAAARVMHRGDVGRLLVVDDNSRLLGIVTRSDLLKIHDRLDAVIRDDVLQRILGDALQIPVGAVRVGVDNGVVTFTGRVKQQRTAAAITGLAIAVPGVTGVVDRLTAHGAGPDAAPRRWLRRPSGRGAADRPGRHGDVPARSAGLCRDIVEEWGRQSFPASDPPANW